jgi:hypothetical protein
MLLDDRQRPGVRRRHHRRQRRRATRQAGLAASLLNASQQLGGALGLAIPAAAPLPAAQRIEQLWRLWELQGGQRLATADPAHIVGVREGRVRQVLGPLRTAHRNTITDREERPVRDRCLELAVKAAGGLDCDHGVFGSTLPGERSPLRGNAFSESSACRQQRQLAEQAHQLAGQVGLRQAARRLGVHRDALKAAFAQWVCRRWSGGWAGSQGPR